MAVSSNNEPQPGAGHSTPLTVTGVAGVRNLIEALTAVAKADRDLAAELRKSRESDPQRSGDVHTARFGNNPSAKEQWESFRAKKQAAIDAADAKKQQDREAQLISQSFTDNAARSAAHATGDFARSKARSRFGSRVSPWTPPQAFPKMGVPSQPTPSSVMNQTGAFAYYGKSGSGSSPGLNLPWQQPSTSAPGWGWGSSSANGGSQASTPRPPHMTVPNLGGGVTPTAGGAGGSRGGGGGGGAAGGGAAGGASGGIGRAVGIGVAAGVAQAAGGALNAYSTRNLNQNYDQFGNLYVLANGGYNSGSYGAASAQGINRLLPVRNEATSPADLIAGSAQIFVNASSTATFGQNLTNAGVTAALSPGLGIAGAAAQQQAEGSNRGHLAAMMLTGQGTRRPGGDQISDVQLANQLLNATRPGKGTAGLTPEKTKAMLSQTGTLRANLNAYGELSGIGAAGVDSLANIITAQTAYQNKYGSTEGFEQTMKSASAGDKSALDKLKGTGIEESVQQSIMTRQGAQIKRDVDTQKDFIDALKASNSAMLHFSNAVTAFLKSSGLDHLLGSAGGANAGTGGRIGSTLAGAGAGALIGGTILPVLGAGPGAAVGAAIGFISGGRAGDGPAPSTGSNSGQNAAPSSTGTSQAASAAIAYAQAQRGKPYVMGATGPGAYDCSGLMQAAYKSAGVDIPRVSSAQFQFGKEVPLDQIAPGDLVFPKGEDGMWGAPAGLPGHVMMALGPGPNVPIVQAGSPSTGIFDSTINVGQIKGARRVTNGVGTVAPDLNKTPRGDVTTNAPTAAGTAQQPAAHAALGMNEVDVLGSVLGRAAWQGPNHTPSSLQSLTMSGAVNGSAVVRPGYAKGALRIDGDQTADLHDGEMVLDSKLARSVRSAVMADIPKHTTAGSGAPTINFSSGSVVINVSGAPTPSAMQSAGKQFVDAVAADRRIQVIGDGL